MKQYFVYMTINLINGKKYIGQHQGSVDDNYLGSGHALKDAIKKYGKENFKREILQIYDSFEEMNQGEIEWINKYNACHSDEFYNIAEGGEGYLKGNPVAGMTPEKKALWKQHLSEAFSGEKNPFYGKGFHGPEHPMWGKHHSEETKEKIRQKALGRKQSKESIEKTQYKNPKRWIIDMYDLTGKYEQTFPDSHTAARWLGLSGNSATRLREAAKKQKPYHEHVFVLRCQFKDIEQFPEPVSTIPVTWE